VPSRRGLPARLERIVGRDDFMREVSDQLLVECFVTIVGPGGMGKTTVAVGVALRTTKTFDDFRATFHDRLGALGRAHGLLFRMREGGRVTFDELANTELAAHAVGAGEDGRVTVDGSRGVPLRSGMVQPLAMALYELVTDAIRYGALKQPNGRLSIRWRLEARGESGKPWIHLDWKESGVEMLPIGATSHNTGHGRELIERALPYQFDAQTTFVTEADGVHCTMSLPASETRAKDRGDRA
jgi:two-component system CheB/CheR fusion protein